MSAEKPCQTELTEAFLCTQAAGPIRCSCFGFEMGSFATEFESRTRQSYMSTQAFVSYDDPEFCERANKNVCLFYETNHSCCCREETETYRRCLVEKIFPQEVNPFAVLPSDEVCLNICTGRLPQEAGSSDPTLGLAVFASLSFLGLCCAVLHQHGFLWNPAKSQKRRGGSRASTIAAVNGPEDALGEGPIGFSSLSVSELSSLTKDKVPDNNTLSPKKRFSWRKVLNLQEKKKEEDYNDVVDDKDISIELGVSEKGRLKERRDSLISAWQGTAKTVPMQFSVSELDTPDEDSESVEIINVNPEAQEEDRDRRGNWESQSGARRSSMRRSSSRRSHRVDSKKDPGHDSITQKGYGSRRSLDVDGNDDRPVSLRSNSTRVSSFEPKSPDGVYDKNVHRNASSSSLPLKKSERIPHRKSSSSSLPIDPTSRRYQDRPKDGAPSERRGSRRSSTARRTSIASRSPSRRRSSSSKKLSSSGQRRRSHEEDSSRCGDLWDSKNSEEELPPLIPY